MLQDIHPRHINLDFAPREPADDDYVVASDGRRILLADAGGPARPPLFRELAAAFPGIDKRATYLFSVDDTGFFSVDGDLPEADGFHYRGILDLREYQPPWLAFAGATAGHLSQWYARNRFCGACGKPMEKKADERALRCGGCGGIVYPAIAPAVIVGVTDGDRLLMTRYANRPYSRLALVAGFMEVGETLEDTVRREVKEEVGVAVKNIRYYKSQPWAFSSSVLMGFYADLDGPPELTVDTNELQEAHWFPRNEIQDDFNALSLTGEMIVAFRENRFPREKP